MGIVNNAYDALFHAECENGRRFNYRSEKLDCDSYKEIKNLQDLTDYFEGGMEYYDDSVFGEEEWTTVAESSWTFASNSFEEYVQDWMNSNGIECTIGVIESGVYSNGVDLCHTETAMEVLNKYRTDIEEILENEMPDDSYTDRYGNFSFARLAVAAFECVLKKYTIDALQIAPQWEDDQRYES